VIELYTRHIGPLLEVGLVFWVWTGSYCLILSHMVSLVSA